MAIIISVFLHEVGHGVSAYYQDIPVSTGFNRVGDIDKKPSDDDFREEFRKWSELNIDEEYLKWDLGPAVTLSMAIIFTFMLKRVSNKDLVLVVGSMALVNALMRLIPMAIAYGSLLFTGSLHVEDEIKQGLIWHEMTGFSSLKYLPSIISIIISIICYRFIIKALRNKLPELFATKGYFAYVVIIISLVAFPILNLLDEYFRINWG